MNVVKYCHKQFGKFLNSVIKHFCQRTNYVLIPIYFSDFVNIEQVHVKNFKVEILESEEFTDDFCVKFDFVRMQIHLLYKE